MRNSPNMSKISLRGSIKREGKKLRKGAKKFILPQLNNSPSPVISPKLFEENVSSQRGIYPNVKILPKKSKIIEIKKIGNKNTIRVTHDLKPQKANSRGIKGILLLFDYYRCPR